MTREAKESLTRFGSVVLSLMAEHGMWRITQLSDRLKARGYEYTNKRIHNWLYGKAQADRGFPKALRAVLPLTEEQKDKLARAFAYGQDEKVGEKVDGAA